MTQQTTPYTNIHLTKTVGDETVVLTAAHTNGKSITFQVPIDQEHNSYLKARLSYFDTHGTMKGY